MYYITPLINIYFYTIRTRVCYMGITHDYETFFANTCQRRYACRAVRNHIVRIIYCVHVPVTRNIILCSPLCVRVRVVMISLVFLSTPRENKVSYDDVPVNTHRRNRTPRARTLLRVRANTAPTLLSLSLPYAVCYNGTHGEIRVKFGAWFSGCVL